jgi:hypothetical protein
MIVPLTVLLLLALLPALVLLWLSLQLLALHLLLLLSLLSTGTSSLLGPGAPDTPSSTWHHRVLSGRCHGILLLLLGLLCVVRGWVPGQSSREQAQYVCSLACKAGMHMLRAHPATTSGHGCNQQEGSWTIDTRQRGVEDVQQTCIIRPGTISTLLEHAPHNYASVTMRGHVIHCNVLGDPGLPEVASLCVCEQRRAAARHATPSVQTSHHRSPVDLCGYSPARWTKQGHSGCPSPTLNPCCSTPFRLWLAGGGKSKAVSHAVRLSRSGRH